MPKELLSVDTDDDEIIISIDRKKKKRKQKNLFYYMPVGVKDIRDENSMSAFGVISQFNKAELALLNILDENMSRLDYCLSVRRKDFTSAEYQKINPAIKLWISRGLLRKIKREYYMVSPYFITPPKDCHEVYKSAWELLEK